MKVTTIAIGFILFAGIYSCSVNKHDINRYRTRFESNRQEFGTLVRLLKEQKLRIGYSVNASELPRNIQTILQNLEIAEVYLKATECQGIVDYEFTCSWSSKATLYFSNDSCEKIQTVKGYHSKQSEMIEVWGLGDGWTMWIDYDFV
jgi:hypothetical protein